MKSFLGTGHDSFSNPEPEAVTLLKTGTREALALLQSRGARITQGSIDVTTAYEISNEEADTRPNVRSID